MPDLTKAREALAAYDAPRCGCPLGATFDALGAVFCPDCNACYVASGDGECPACGWCSLGRCNLPMGHAEGCAIDCSGPDVEHLRDALDEVDRLAGDLAALRIEHGAHAVLLDCARRDRDEARGRLAAVTAAARAVLALTGDETMEEQDAVMDALAGLVGVDRG